jgi:hypothetical protein
MLEGRPRLAKDAIPKTLDDEQSKSFRGANSMLTLPLEFVFSLVIGSSEAADTSFH